MIFKLYNKLWRNVKIHSVTVSLIKRNAHLFDYSVQSPYQIPTHIFNILHTANASLGEHVLFNFHCAIQVAYKDLIEQVNEHVMFDNSSQQIINSFIKHIEPSKNIFQCTFPFLQENGDVNMIHGCRVQHCNYKMPYLGGIRITENVSVDDLKGLASFLTFQYANIQLPFSGSFGCININPNNIHNPSDLQNIVARYTRECSKYRFIDPATDIVFPDLNTSSREMNWIADTFQQINGPENLNTDSVATGKSSDHNGMDNYDFCASYAIYCSLDNLFMDHEKMSALNLTPNWSDKTFVIHGFGKVGQNVTLHLSKIGAKCVGIQDINKGAVFNNDGLNIPAVIEFFEKNKTLVGCCDGTEYKSDITGYCADIVILSSTQKTLNSFNVDHVVAKVVIEAAYLAITPAAHKTLIAKNILVLPDILVACGSAIGSYMEYIKNINRITFGHIGWEDNLLGNEVTLSVRNAVAEITSEKSISSDAVTLKKDKIIKTSGVNEGEIIKKVITATMARTNEEACNTLEKYGLGLDLRMACYVNAIKYMFDVFYKQIKLSEILKSNNK